MIMKYDFSKSDYMARFQDYAAHRCSKNGAFDTTMSLDQKKQRLDVEFFSEVSRLSGVNRGDTDIALNAWMSNPSVQWAAFSIVDKQIQIIIKLLGNPVLDSLTEVSTVAAGDSLKLNVKPGYRYTVSAGANGERMTNRQRKFEGEILLSPKQHIIQTYTKMFNVLSGKESASEVSFQVAESFKLAKQQDAFECLRKHMETQSLSFRGVPTATDILKVCAYIEQMNGVKPTIYGTSSAVAQMPGKLGSNYRVNVDGTDTKVGLMSDFYGYGVAVLPNVLASYDPKAAGSSWAATANLDAEFAGGINIGGAVGANDYLYVLSAMNVKPLAMVEAADGSEVYDARNFADLTNNMVFTASWDVAAVTPYTDAVIKLQ